MPQPNTPRLRVCAVSYLNTTPLVWGMLHGPQRGLFDLDFQIPAACADQLASGAADIGIIPSFAGEIHRLAVDSSSRTSVQLARVLLERRFAAEPELIPHTPDLDAMLRIADAALIIGDPALRIEPSRLPYYVYDLGKEWVEMTGLPFVFAVWAGRKSVITPGVVDAFQQSCRFGRERIEEIVAAESGRREIPRDLVREYLTHRIVHELGPRDYEGMDRFLEYARPRAPSA